MIRLLDGLADFRAPVAVQYGALVQETVVQSPGQSQRRNEEVVVRWRIASPARRCGRHNIRWSFSRGLKVGGNVVVLTIEAHWDIKMASKIGTAEFKNRLAALCLRGGGRGLPRKPRDQHILFKSVTLMLEHKRHYAEDELNERLLTWLSQVGRAIDIDHVSLRRYLVDAGYLTRDTAGRSYKVDSEQAVGLFEAGVEDINPVAVVEEAYRDAEERKREYLEKRERE